MHERAIHICACRSSIASFLTRLVTNEDKVSPKHKQQTFIYNTDKSPWLPPRARVDVDKVRTVTATRPSKTDTKEKQHDNINGLKQAMNVSKLNQCF